MTVQGVKSENVSDASVSGVFSLPVVSDKDYATCVKDIQKTAKKGKALARG
jgi:hypothetical protein